MTIKFIDYKNELLEVIKSIKSDFIAIDEMSDNKIEFVDKYIMGHKQRIAKGIEMLSRYIGYDKKILEVGSPHPFFSYYFYKYKNASVVCADLYDRKWKVNDRLYFKKLNLCTDMLNEKFDVIIASEVWEHLPCNLYAVRDMLCNSLNEDGVMLFTFPMSKKSEVPLNYSAQKELFCRANGHLREFKDLTDDFLSSIEVIERAYVKCSHYKFDIELDVCKMWGNRISGY